MDVVTDLSSQCVSFITVFQEICKERIIDQNINPITFSFFLEQAAEIKWHLEDHIKDPSLDSQINFSDSLKKRIGEIVCTCEGSKVSDATCEKFVLTCCELVIWVEIFKKFDEGYKLPGIFSSSYEWRQCIRKILYSDTSQRIILSGYLEYMPVQVILCLGAKTLDFEQQRMLQVWGTGGELNILSPKNKEFNEAWWRAGFKIIVQRIVKEKRYEGSLLGRSFGITVPGTREVNDITKNVIRAEYAAVLLKDDCELLKALEFEENPIPFETLFSDELDEIVASRQIRRKVEDAKKFWADDDIDDMPKGDPHVRAKSLNLYALAFSGGGIRSATFNLGILQKLAEMGLLARFDYLSTVSGGGYIGSWFASWVKRNGSIDKVMDRLNPKKSMNPLSDEVRPIRWLRMFSNYLAPNAGLMSVDSWTMGITWLRNTVINQTVLLLLLCSALSVIKVIYNLWWFAPATTIDPIGVLISGSVILISGGILAGLGMSSFEPERFPGKFNMGNSRWLYWVLIGWGGLSTFVLSAWFYDHSGCAGTLSAKIDSLLWAGVAGFVSFLLVAFIGRYDMCERADKQYWKVYAAIIISSALAAGSGLLLLSASWQVLDNIAQSVPIYKDFKNSEFAFIFGVPLLLETISITVVVRMAIMGILFPDLRREWWGRMGALVHRFIFIWLLVAGAALFLPRCYHHLIHSKHFASFEKTLPVLLGGWSAIVGYAVKLAYGSKNTGQTKSDGSLPASEIFIRIAPYIFAVGFLLIGSLALQGIDKLASDYVAPFLGKIFTNEPNGSIINGFEAILLIVLTYALSRCIGVNEFSLHHFYRNRLSRAYLGATRRREDRDKTVNSFTGFDGNDDLLLTDLRVKNNFSGPYPVINVTLNSTVVSDLDRQDRKAESFVFTPKYCGFDFCRARPSANSEANPYEYGYRPTGQYAYPEGPHLSTAMTISGAAVNPNMGFHSSPAIAFLLTIFNVRLGWWMGNPRKADWKRADPKYGLVYLIKDLFGSSNVNSRYVCLSDGGHFDNMGLYEMVRRRCKHIVLCDAEEDENSSCDGLANAIRRCRIDFGVEIRLNVGPITQKDEKTKYSKQHLVKGTITYPGDIVPSGTIVYIKTSLTGDETVDIREYFMDNPTFPQQSTADQFFDESQFESYRKLGYSSITSLSEAKNKNQETYL